MRSEFEYIKHRNVPSEKEGGAKPQLLTEEELVTAEDTPFEEITETPKINTNDKNISKEEEYVKEQERIADEKTQKIEALMGEINKQEGASSEGAKTRTQKRPRINKAQRVLIPNQKTTNKKEKYIESEEYKKYKASKKEKVEQIVELATNSIIKGTEYSAGDTVEFDGDTAIKTTGEERERYSRMGHSGLTEEDFKDIPEWNNLNDLQKTFVIEQISQDTLSKVREIGEERFQEKMKDCGVIKKIGKNLVKSYWISKEEKSAIQDFKYGKIKPSKDTVEFFVKRMTDLDLDTYSDGIEVTRINFLKSNTTNENEQKQFNNFNEKADAFSQLPDSWKNKNGVKRSEYKKYIKAKNSYEEDRNEILYSKIKEYESLGMSSEIATGKAMMDIKEVDRKVSMLQFTQTNPWVYKELNKIENEKSWKRLLNNENLWRGVYMTTGFVSRKALTYSIGLIAAPLVSGAIGGIRNRQKAKNKIEMALAGGNKELTRKERAGLGLSGIMDDKNKNRGKVSKIISAQEVNAREVGAFVDADIQIQRLEKLLNEFEKAKNINDKISTGHKLQTRLTYVESKQEKGLMNYGKENSAGLNYDLFKIMSQVDISLSIYQDLLNKAQADFNESENMSDIEKISYNFILSEMENREILLNEVREKNASAFGKKIATIKNQEMIRGATVGATFSLLTWKITDLMHGGNGELFSGGKLKSFFANSLRGDQDTLTNLPINNGIENVNGQIDVLKLTPEQKIYMDSLFGKNSTDSIDVISAQKIAEIKDLNVEVTTDKGRGIISTIKAMQKNLENEYKNLTPEKIPKNAEHIIKTKAEDLAKEYGMYRPGEDAESAKIISGDKLIFNKETGELKFHQIRTGEDISLEKGKEYVGKMFDSDHSAKNEVIYPNSREASVNSDLQSEDVKIEPTEPTNTDIPYNKIYLENNVYKPVVSRDNFINDETSDTNNLIRNDHHEEVINNHKEKIIQEERSAETKKENSFTKPEDLKPDNSEPSVTTTERIPAKIAMAERTGVLNKYNIDSYTPDTTHEVNISRILRGMGKMETKEDIDKYLSRYEEDVPVTSKMIIEASEKYEVDRRLMMAIMQEDSSFGTRGVGADTFNPGNVGNYGSNRIDFEKWENGVDAVAKWLNKHRN